MIKLALPGGDLRGETAALMSSIGLHSEDYAAGSRSYRFPLASEEAELRVFREKDIPIQVALGNYDLGICNNIWLQELVARYPQNDVVALRSLGYGKFELVAAAAAETLTLLGPFEAWLNVEGLRIASEFPNLTERFALQARLPRYYLVSLWGAAASYPPEDAELAVFPVPLGASVARGLTRVATLASGSEWLLANRDSLQHKNLAPILGPILALPAAAEDSTPSSSRPLMRRIGVRQAHSRTTRREVRLALPDGHAQRHTYAALASAGLAFEGYGEREAVVRPDSGIAGLTIKVIRPQDMAQQVALGNFDFAITGRDWLFDHRIAFPSSPVREIVDLRRSRYSISVVVDETIPGDSLSDALDYWRSTGRTIVRVASEYPNLADQFARQHHIGRYQVIPVAGASEGFVPEDCEILIEGTETGTSIAANRLKVIDRLFESTNCLIGSDQPIDSERAELYNDLIHRLQRSVAVTA